MSETYYVTIRLTGNPYQRAAVETALGYMRSVCGAEVEASIHDNLDDFLAEHVLDVLASGEE